MLTQHTNTRQLKQTDRDLTLVKSPEVSDVEDGGLPMIGSISQWVAIQRQFPEHVTLREACNVIKTGGRVKDNSAPEQEKQLCFKVSLAPKVRHGL